MLQILTKAIFKPFLIFFLLVHVLQVISFKTDVKVSNSLFNNIIIPFAKIDGFGRVAEAINKFYEAFQKPAALADYCKPQLRRLGTFQLHVSWRPFGNCSHCCKIDNIDEHIKLYYFSKKNKGIPTKIPAVKKAGNLRSVGFDINSETIIYIHGFSESGLGPYSIKICNAYLRRKELYNIISVDWRDLCPFPWYSLSIQNTKLVAKKLAEFIQFYNSKGEMPINKIHLIGFSLGAHVAGMVGKALKNEKLPRITAIDPAFPLYYREDSDSKVSKYDAHFIDVIHTDGGKLGYINSVGHADFFPNGGSYPQPGCSLTDLVSNRAVELIGTCDHFRGVELYAESVLHPESFPATYFYIANRTLPNNISFVVDSYMGFLANKSSTVGDYYLITGNSKPFGKSAREQEMELNKNDL